MPPDDEYNARLQKALAEAHFVNTLLGPANTAEAVLAFEVRRLHHVVGRIREMVRGWRVIEMEQRAAAEHWTAQGDAFAWHAVRAVGYADILDAHARVMDAILEDIEVSGG